MVTTIKVHDVVDTDSGYGYVTGVDGDLLDIALANNARGYVVALATDVDPIGLSRGNLTPQQVAFISAW